MRAFDGAGAVARIHGGSARGETDGARQTGQDRRGGDKRGETNGGDTGEGVDTVKRRTETIADFQVTRTGGAIG